jgi:hypothetical protein
MSPMMAAHCSGSWPLQPPHTINSEIADGVGAKGVAPDEVLLQQGGSPVGLAHKSQLFAAFRGNDGTRDWRWPRHRGLGISGGNESDATCKRQKLKEKTEHGSLHAREAHLAAIGPKPEPSQH